MFEAFGIIVHVLCWRRRGANILALALLSTGRLSTCCSLRLAATAGYELRDFLGVRRWYSLFGFFLLGLGAALFLYFVRLVLLTRSAGLRGGAICCRRRCGCFCGCVLCLVSRDALLRQDCVVCSVTYHACVVIGDVRIRVVRFGWR